MPSPRDGASTVPATPSRDHDATDDTSGVPEGLILAYGRFVERRAGCCILVSLVFFLFMAVLGGVLKGIPDFSQAAKGFEPRGTDIHGRYMQQDLLECYAAGVYPAAEGDTPASKCIEFHESERRRRRLREGPTTEIAPPPDATTPIARRRRLAPLPSQSGPQRCLAHARAPATGGPAQDASDSTRLSFVFDDSSDPQGGDGLLTAAALRAMCAVGDKLAAVDGFADACTLSAWDDDGACCGSRSIGAWFAAWAGRASCAELTDADVADGAAALAACAPAYHNKTLRKDCEDPAKPPCAVSALCHASKTEGNGVYDILHHLADFMYLNPDYAAPGASDDDAPTDGGEDRPALKNRHGVLRRARVLAPFEFDYHAKSGEPEGRGRQWIVDTLNDGGHLRAWMDESNGVDGAPAAPGVTFVSWSGDGGVKFRVFNKQLGTDTVFAVGAVGSIFLIMWWHTGSAFVSALAYCQILLSAAFTYTARQDSAEDFCRLKAQRCTAMGCLLIPAYFSANP